MATQHRETLSQKPNQQKTQIKTNNPPQNKQTNKTQPHFKKANRNHILLRFFYILCYLETRSLYAAQACFILAVFPPLLSRCLIIGMHHQPQHSLLRGMHAHTCTCTLPKKKPKVKCGGMWKDNSSFHQVFECSDRNSF